MSELHSPELDDNPEVVHEESDVNVRAILGFGAGLLALGLVVHVFLFWLQGFYASQTRRAETIVYPMAAGRQDQLPPEPRLQDNPQQDLRELRAAQTSALAGYEWVDKDAGVVRIPIDEAMRIVVERGLPTSVTSK